MGIVRRIVHCFMAMEADDLLKSLDKMRKQVSSLSIIIFKTDSI